MSGGDDREIARLFDALRRADRAADPGFATMWARARHRAQSRGIRRRPTRLAWGVLAGAAALGGAALLLRFSLGPAVRRSLSDDEAVAVARSLSSWEAPSDALLDLDGTRRILVIDADLTLSSVTLPEITIDTTERRTP